MTLTSAAVLLFFVMDPLGNVPLYVTALKHVPPERQRAVIVRELFIALFVLVAFLFVGPLLLRLLHLSELSLRVAGGVVLLLIALRMIFPSDDKSLHEPVDGEPFVVPLAIPYTAGPSAMATVMLLLSQEPDRWPEWLGAVVLAWLGVASILSFAGTIRQRLGDRGLVAVERLMGLLLVALSVELLLTGMALFLGLPPPAA